MSRTRWQRWRLPFICFLLAVGWFGALWVIDLRGEEPRRALVAWEMLKSGDYLRPTIQGEPYYNKPPLFNWLIALCYQIFGTESWVVRLPSLLAYVLWGYVNFRVVRRYLDAKTALWSTLFFYTAAHYLFFGTVLAGELDLLYGFIVYGQGVVVFHYFLRRQWWQLFFFSYFLLGLGFMTKGLPSVAYQGLTFIGLAAFGPWLRAAVEEDEFGLQSSRASSFKERFGWLLDYRHILGALAGLAPVILYFWYYDQRYGNGDLYLFNLVEEASQKSVTEGGGLEIVRHVFELPFQFLIDHLPWVLLLPYGIWKGWQREGLDRPFLRFCIIFFGVNVILYWLSPGARIRYFYGLVPFFFTPLAYWMLRHRPLKMRYLWIVLFLLAGLRIVYNYSILPYQQKTTGTIQLYRQITNDALHYAAGKPLYTCCEADTILVDPSIAGYTLLRDTIFIPMYTPYQIPLYLQRERDEWLPFQRDLESPGIYLSTDTVGGKLLEEYQVWDDKTLRLFKIE
ncbi:hypothetical protein CEQ90_10720 [Lewinellaceae bacterium SD302]|nr:hypothetical protein CEQ90_10720 [Lewinellaceae bacterium SD302]